MSIVSRLRSSLPGFCAKGFGSRLVTLLCYVAALSAMALRPSAASAASDTMGRKRVAVVLSGGGAKGMAHIGALKVIEKAGIPIDIITGTSMGAIVGGLYSVGYDAATLDSMVRVLDWPYLLADKPEMRSRMLDNRRKQNIYAFSRLVALGRGRGERSTGGFVEGRNLERLFARLTSAYPDSMSFDSLPIPFACVATDVVDNTEYDFRSGRLAEAMRASMSIPGVFAPVRKDGMVLVDGGLRNNFPVDLAREMGADVVIGITVQNDLKTADELKSSSSVLLQIVDINCKNKYDENLDMTDLPIRVDATGYSAASFTPTAVDSLIRRGEEAAMHNWDKLLELKRRIGVGADEKVERRPIVRVPVLMSDTAVAGPRRTMLHASLGVRFDTEDIVALQMNGTLRPKHSRLTLDGTVRLGKRIMARAEMAYKPTDFGKMTIGYTFRRNDMYIYKEGERDLNMTFNQHEVDVSPLNFNVRNFNFSLGGRWEHYGFVDILSRLSDHNLEQMKKENHAEYYADVSYNSEDDWYFPTRGARFEASYAYLTDNFVGYGGHAGISEVAASWRMAFALSRRLTFQPMVYGRLLTDGDVPMMRRNAVGGDSFGHYLRQQMPFAGVGYAEFVDDQFVALQLLLSQRIADNNYVQLRLTGAQMGRDIGSLFENKTQMGCQASYFYNSMLGPLGASLGWSTLTDSGYFYISLGFEF